MKVKFSATTHDRINSVPIENGQVIAILDQPGYYYDFSGTRYSITPPAAVSQLTNDLGFITNAVDDLTNYYDKDEVDTLIGSVASLDIQVVNSLPTTDISTTTIYLVPTSDPGQENVKDEYINTTGTSAGWEKIGSTSVDLSDYVTQSDLSSTLEGYVESYEFEELRDNVEQNYLLKYNSDQYSDSIQIDTSSNMLLNGDSGVSITSDSTISLESGNSSNIDLQSDASVNINASTVTISNGYSSADAVDVNASTVTINASTVTFGSYQNVDTLSINASTFSVSTDSSGYDGGINLTGSQFGVAVNSNSMTMGNSGTTISGNGKVVIDEGSCSGPSITVGQKTVPGSGTLDGVIVESNRSIYLIGNSINLVANDDEIYIKGSSSSQKNLFDLITIFEAMCPIETTAATSRSYQKGDIFYASSYANLYQATADIPSGTSIYSAPTQAIGNLGEAMRYIVSMSNT